MKKVVAISAVLAVAAVANAGYIKWSGNSFGGDPVGSVAQKDWVVELYQDVGFNNQAGWQNTTTPGSGLSLINNAGVIQINVAGAGLGTSDDAMLGLFTKIQSPVAAIKSLVASGLTVPDSIQLYSVIYNNVVKADATEFLVLDINTFNSGSVVAPGVPLNYNAFTTGNPIVGQWTTIIPEPATFGMMAIAGLGMFLARKKTRG